MLPGSCCERDPFLLHLRLGNLERVLDSWLGRCPGPPHPPSKFALYLRSARPDLHICNQTKTKAPHLHWWPVEGNQQANDVRDGRGWSSIRWARRWFHPKKWRARVTTKNLDPYSQHWCFVSYFPSKDESIVSPTVPRTTRLRTSIPECPASISLNTSDRLLGFFKLLHTYKLCYSTLPE